MPRAACRRGVVLGPLGPLAPLAALALAAAAECGAPPAAWLGGSSASVLVGAMTAFNAGVACGQATPGCGSSDGDHLNGAVAAFNAGVVCGQTAYACGAPAYAAAIAAVPAFPRAHSNLALLADAAPAGVAGAPEVAARHFTAVVELWRAAAGRVSRAAAPEEPRVDETPACLGSLAAAAAVNLGHRAAEGGDTAGAIAWLREALEADPDGTEALEAHTNLGAELLRERRFGESYGHSAAALRVEPRCCPALVNAVGALLEVWALPELRRVLVAAAAAGGPAGGPECLVRWPHVETRALFALGEWDGAAAAAFAAAARHPENAHLALADFATRAALGDWSRHASAPDVVSALLAAARADARAGACEQRVPLVAIDVLHAPAPASAVRHIVECEGAAAPGRRSCIARASGGERGAGRAARTTRQRRGDDRTMSIGFLSGDFRTHVMGRLLLGTVAELLRPRGVACISVDVGGNWSGDELRAKFQRLCCPFVDVAHGQDPTSDVARVSALALDVLFDVSGRTVGARADLLARRPAPVIVNYLGYPGTMGNDVHDFVLADRVVVVAEAAAAAFSEAVVLLPVTYQVNSHRALLPSNASGERAAAAAAEAAVERAQHACAFASYNSVKKIGPTFFDIWMRALLRHPRCVLALLAMPGSYARGQVTREAAARGIAPSRVVFVPFASWEEHIQRLEHIDLVVDTLPYGSHSTATDALWARVPVLTVVSDAMHGRVAASLLHAAGAPALVTSSLREYEDVLDRVLTWVTTRSGRVGGGPAARFTQGVRQSALFDELSLVRDVERAAKSMRSLSLLGARGSNCTGGTWRSWQRHVVVTRRTE